jgi:hypothetical protein
MENNRHRLLKQRFLKAPSAQQTFGPALQKAKLYSNSQSDARSRGFTSLTFFFGSHAEKLARRKTPSGAHFRKIISVIYGRAENKVALRTRGCARARNVNKQMARWTCILIIKVFLIHVLEYKETRSTFQEREPCI